MTCLPGISMNFSVTDKSHRGKYQGNFYVIIVLKVSNGLAISNLRNISNV